MIPIPDKPDGLLSQQNSEPLEPTIDWLVDQIAPEHSPLLDFNKKRLRELIVQDRTHQKATLLEAIEEGLPKKLEECFVKDPVTGADITNEFYNGANMVVRIANEKLDQVLAVITKIREG